MSMWRHCSAFFVSVYCEIGSQVTKNTATKHVGRELSRGEIFTPPKILKSLTPVKVSKLAILLYCFMLYVSTTQLPLRDW